MYIGLLVRGKRPRAGMFAGGSFLGSVFVGLSSYVFCIIHFECVYCRGVTSEVFLL